MNKPYHYTESGLNNVFINGLLIENDDDGDAIITIPAVNSLHKTIATGIIMHNRGIDGAELRFIRTEMGMTQAELAMLVHRDQQTIGRWERSDIDIDSASEVIIRILAIQKLDLPIKVDVEEISKKSVSTTEHQSINIQMSNNNHSPYELLAA